jgi:hypothetical protein
VVQGAEFERRAREFEDGRIVGVGSIGAILVARGEGGEQQGRRQKDPVVFHQFVF